MYIYIYIREKPCHELQIEVSQGGYQANMAASSIHGLLGLNPCYYPPDVAHIFLPAGAYSQKSVSLLHILHKSHCILTFEKLWCSSRRCYAGVGGAGRPRPGAQGSAPSCPGDPMMHAYVCRVGCVGAWEKAQMHHRHLCMWRCFERDAQLPRVALGWGGYHTLLT